MHSTLKKRHHSDAITPNNVDSRPSSSSTSSITAPSSVFQSEQERQIEYQNSLNQSKERLKLKWEDIFQRFERDFEGQDDVIDLETGQIVESHGHLQSLIDHEDADVFSYEDDDVEDENIEEDVEDHDREIALESLNIQEIVQAMNKEPSLDIHIEEKGVANTKAKEDINGLSEEISAGHDGHKVPQAVGSSSSTSIKQQEKLSRAGIEQEKEASLIALPTPTTPSLDFLNTFDPFSDNLPLFTNDGNAQDLVFELPLHNMSIAFSETKLMSDDTEGDQMDNSQQLGESEVPSDEFILQHFGAHGPELVAYLHKIREKSVEISSSESQNHISSKDKAGFQAQNKTNGENVSAFTNTGSQPGPDRHSSSIEEDLTVEKTIHIEQADCFMQDAGLPTPPETAQRINPQNLQAADYGIKLIELIESVADSKQDEDGGAPWPVTEMKTSPGFKPVENLDSSDINGTPSHTSNKDKPISVWDSLPDDPFLDPAWVDKHPDGEPDEAEFLRRRAAMEIYAATNREETKPSEKSTVTPRRLQNTPKQNIKSASKSSQKKKKDNTEEVLYTPRGGNYLQYLKKRKSDINLKPDTGSPRKKLFGTPKKSYNGNNVDGIVLEEDDIWDLQDEDIKVTKAQTKATIMPPPEYNPQKITGEVKIKKEEDLTGFETAKCGDIGYRCSKTICFQCFEN